MCMVDKEKKTISIYINMLVPKDEPHEDMPNVQPIVKVIR